MSMNNIITLLQQHFIFPERAKVDTDTVDKKSKMFQSDF